MSDQPKASLLREFLCKRARFGVRTLLVTITILAIALGWLVQRVERQRAAVEEIERRGSRVVFAHENAHRQALMNAETAGPSSREAPPPSPAWLRRWLSPHYFENVENVYLKLDQAGSDADWPLGDLPGVKSLVVRDGRVSNSLLRSIGEARSLEAVDFKEVEFDEAGLADLTDLRNLKQIDVTLGSITAQVFRKLCQIPNLEEFTILETKMEPAAFTALDSLQHVRRLYLMNVDVRDECVYQIAKMRSLEYLRVMGTAITAERIEQLRRERPHLEIDYFAAVPSPEPGHETEMTDASAGSQ